MPCILELPAQELVFSYSSVMSASIMSAEQLVTLLWSHTHDYYGIFDISKVSSDRERFEAQLKSKYFKVARALHPDKVGNTPENTARFQECNSAYFVLKDASKRILYDQFCNLLRRLELRANEFASLPAYIRQILHNDFKQIVEKGVRVRQALAMNDLIEARGWLKHVEKHYEDCVAFLADDAETTIYSKEAVEEQDEHVAVEEQDPDEALDGEGRADTLAAMPRLGKKRRAAIESSCAKRLRTELVLSSDIFDGVACHFCNGLGCMHVLVGNRALRWRNIRATCTTCGGRGWTKQPAPPTRTFSGIWLHSLNLQQIHMTEDADVVVIQHPTVGTRRINKDEFLTGGFYGLRGEFHDDTSIKWANGAQWKKLE